MFKSIQRLMDGGFDPLGLLSGAQRLAQRIGDAVEGARVQDELATSFEAAMRAASRQLADGSFADAQLRKLEAGEAIQPEDLIRLESIAGSSRTRLDELLGDATASGKARGYTIEQRLGQAGAAFNLLGKASKAMGTPLTNEESESLLVSILEKHLGECIDTIHEILDAKKAARASTAWSAEQLISSILRNRVRIGVELSPALLMRAAEIRGRFPEIRALQSEHIEEMRSIGPLPTAASVKVDEPKAPTRADALSKLSFMKPSELLAVIDEIGTGLEPPLSAEERSELVAQSVHWALEGALSALRTIIYDRNPFTADEGLQKIVAIRVDLELLSAQGLSLDESRGWMTGVGDVKRLSEYEAVLRTMKEEAASMTAGAS